jgi:hypothetical protein
MRWTAALAVLAAAGCLDAPPGALPIDGAEGEPDPVLLSAYGFDAPDPLADSSGNGNAASCSQCPAWINDRHDIGQAALFDGDDDVVTMPSIGTGSFTVMAWVRMDSDTGLACPINRPFGGTPYNTYQLCMRVPAAGVGRVYFYTEANPRQMFADVVMEIGSWHHAAIRLDGTSKTISWDGSDQVTSPGETSFDQSEIRLGNDLDGEDIVAPFTGALDTVEIWQGALSEEEIALAAGL